ncbi:MAG: hypothetical protein JAY98_16780 [Candidatus Thiodiazotropha lotti]|nr:hypothetical protein [Candidatus Thiodiazotropha lotti]MCW4184850.1 hypothetical protein [Candidatus Thiodiazotropha weberae]
MPYIEEIEKNRFKNRETVRKSTVCACVDCGKEFLPSDIQEEEKMMEDNDTTVCCPCCLTPTLVGDAGFSSQEAFNCAKSAPCKDLVVRKSACVEAAPPAYSGKLVIAGYEGESEVYLLKFLIKDELEAQQKDFENSTCLFALKDVFAVGLLCGNYQKALEEAKRLYGLGERDWRDVDYPRELGAI